MTGTTAAAALPGLAVCAVLLSGGCAGRAAATPSPPVAELVVYHDGFHSAILVEEPDGWFEWGFGDRLWLTGEDTSTAHALRLACIPSPAYIYRRPVEAGTVFAVNGRSTFVLAMDGQEVASLRQALAGWVAGPGSEWLDGIRLYPCTRTWVGWRSCHDFTAAMAEAAGYQCRRPSSAPPCRWSTISPSHGRTAVCENTIQRVSCRYDEQRRRTR